MDGLNIYMPVPMEIVPSVRVNSRVGGYLNKCDAIIDLFSIFLPLKEILRLRRCCKRSPLSYVLNKVIDIAETLCEFLVPREVSRLRACSHDCKELPFKNCNDRISSCSRVRYIEKNLARTTRFVMRTHGPSVLAYPFQLKTYLLDPLMKNKQMTHLLIHINDMDSHFAMLVMILLNCWPNLQTVMLSYTTLARKQEEHNLSDILTMLESYREEDPPLKLPFNINLSYYLRNLTLSVSGACALDNCMIYECERNQTRLEMLSIRIVDDARMEFFTQHFNYCETLQELAIHFSTTQISIDHLIAFLIDENGYSKRPNLTTLRIRTKSNSSLHTKEQETEMQTSLIFSASKLPFLLHLDVEPSDSHLFWDEGLDKEFERLLDVLERLQTLSFSLSFFGQEQRYTYAHRIFRRLFLQDSLLDIQLTISSPMDDRKEVYFGPGIFPMCPICCSNVLVKREGRGFRCGLGSCTKSFFDDRLSNLKMFHLRSQCWYLFALFLNLLHLLPNLTTVTFIYNEVESAHISGGRERCFTRFTEHAAGMISEVQRLQNSKLRLITIGFLCPRGSFIGLYYECVCAVIDNNSCNKLGYRKLGTKKVLQRGEKGPDGTFFLMQFGFLNEGESDGEIIQNIQLSQRQTSRF